MAVSTAFVTAAGEIVLLALTADFLAQLYCLLQVRFIQRQLPDAHVLQKVQLGAHNSFAGVQLFRSILIQRQLISIAQLHLVRLRRRTCFIVHYNHLIIFVKGQQIDYALSRQLLLQRLYKF